MAQRYPSLLPQFPTELNMLGIAGQPSPAIPGPVNQLGQYYHNWGPGIRLGNGRLSAPPALAGPMNMGQFGYAPVGPEEHEELERNYGIPPPSYLGPLQNLGLVRRPGERLGGRNMFRRASGVALGTGVISGNPVAAGAGALGLVANHAWGNNHQGPMGPSQLRQPAKQKKTVKIHNKAKVRQFGFNEAATEAADPTQNEEVNTLDHRPNKRPGYGRPLAKNDPKRNGASSSAKYYGPNGRPSAFNTQNQNDRLMPPTQGNEVRVALNLHNELENKGPPTLENREATAPAPAPTAPRNGSAASLLRPPTAPRNGSAASLLRPSTAPRNGSAASLLSPPAMNQPGGPGILGRILGAVGMGAAAMGSPGGLQNRSSSSPSSESLRGGRSRRQKKRKTQSKSRRHRTRRH